MTYITGVFFTAEHLFINPYFAAVRHRFLAGHRQRWNLIPTPNLVPGRKNGYRDRLLITLVPAPDHERSCILINRHRQHSALRWNRVWSEHHVVSRFCYVCCLYPLWLCLFLGFYDAAIPRGASRPFAWVRFSLNTAVAALNPKAGPVIVFLDVQ